MAKFGLNTIRKAGSGGLDPVCKGVHTY
jgi:hypothetical protein